MGPKKVKKVMTLPINVIFSHLQVRLLTVLDWRTHELTRFV